MHVRPVVSHSVIAPSHLLEPIAIKLSPRDPYPVSMRSNRAFKGQTTQRNDRDRRIQLARSLLVILSQSVVLGDTSADDSVGKLHLNVTIVKFIHSQLGNFANCPVAHELTKRALKYLLGPDYQVPGSVIS